MSAVNKALVDEVLSLIKTCQFRKLLDDYFDDKFHWVIKGTSLLSGTYTDKEVFWNKGIARLSQCLNDDWQIHILDYYICGQTLIAEMRGDVSTKAGGNYNNEYCWVFHFKDNKVIKLTAYYDSLLVNKTLTENEAL